MFEDRKYLYNLITYYSYYNSVSDGYFLYQNKEYLSKVEYVSCGSF